MSRKKEERRLRIALEWPSRFLFGDDIFISYSRADGVTYATGLADLLAGHNFSCRFDQWGTEPGKEMPASLKDALRRSALLVLVGSEGAAQSTHVAQEVAEMKRRGRRIVPVAFEGVLLRGGVTCVDGALARVGHAVTGTHTEAMWAGDIEGLPVSCERGGALKTGEPSAEVVSRIEKTFTFSRKDERLRRATTFVAALLLLLVGASVVAGYVATRKGQEARRMTAEAALAEGRARAAEGKAKEQEENARLQTARAEEAAAKAERAEALARDKTKLADEKTQLAAEKTRLANEQTRKAEAASLRAAEQELSARKNLARNFYAQAQAESADPLRALVWAESAVREAPAGDEDLSSYVLRTLYLAAVTPVSVVNSPAGTGTLVFSPGGETAVTVTKSGQFYVWDVRVGGLLPHPFRVAGADYVLDMDNIVEPAFSPDGGRIALLLWEPTGPGGSHELHLRIWEARTATPVKDLRLEGWATPARPTSDFVAPPGSAPPRAAESNGKMPAAVKFSPDGKEVMVNTLAGGGLFVWDIASGARREYESPSPLLKRGDFRWQRLLGVPGGIFYDYLPISSDPARNWLLEVHNGLRVRDVKTGRVEGQITFLNKDDLGPERVISAEFTADARKVVVTTETDKQHYLRVWDVVSGKISKPAALFSGRGSPNNEMFWMSGAHSVSPDGKRVLLMHYVWGRLMSVEAWDISGDEPKHSSQYVFGLTKVGVEPLPVDNAHYTADGDYVVGVSSEQVMVLNARTGNFVAPPLRISRGRVVDISTRDKTATALYNDGTVMTWDLMRERLPGKSEVGRLPSDASVIGVSPDRKSFVITRSDPNDSSKNMVELADAATGVTKAKLPIVSREYATFSHDGARFAVKEPVRYSDNHDEQRNLRVYRASDGALEPGFRAIPVDSSTRLEFSRDGTALVTMRQKGLEGVEVRRWSALTGEPLSGRGGMIPKYLTINDKGLLRIWFCDDFAGGAPSWVARMSEALTGMRVVGGMYLQRLPPGEYARVRREFTAALARAAAAGDEVARSLLNNLKR